MAKAQAHTQVRSMDIQYERVERFSTPSVLTVHFGSSAIRNGKVQLWVSESLVKELGAQRVVPQPESTAVGGAGLLYTFSATAIPASAEFALQPARSGLADLGFRVADREQMNLRIFVMP